MRKCNAPIYPILNKWLRIDNLFEIILIRKNKTKNLPKTTLQARFSFPLKIKAEKLHRVSVRPLWSCIINTADRRMSPSLPQENTVKNTWLCSNKSLVNSPCWRARLPSLHIKAVESLFITLLIKVHVPSGIKWWPLLFYLSCIHFLM